MGKVDRIEPGIGDIVLLYSIVNNKYIDKVDNNDLPVILKILHEMYDRQTGKLDIIDEKLL